MAHTYRIAGIFLLVLFSTTGIASNSISFQGSVVYPSCHSTVDTGHGNTRVIVEGCGNQSLSASDHVAKRYLETVTGKAPSTVVRQAKGTDNIQDQIIARHAKPMKMRYVIEYH